MPRISSAAKVFQGIFGAVLRVGGSLDTSRAAPGVATGRATVPRDTGFNAMIVPERHIAIAAADLRPPTSDDAEAIFRNYSSDPDVTKYLSWPRHTEVTQTKEFLATCPKGWESGEDFTWAICPKGSGECVGMIGLRMRGVTADVGYVLSKRYWGKGIMSEALARIVDWAIAQDGVVRVWAECHVDNAASARIMEKAGMQREGRLREHAVFPNLKGEPEDCYVYARVK